MEKKSWAVTSDVIQSCLDNSRGEEFYNDTHGANGRKETNTITGFA